jgi:hypothetical protein
MASLSWRCLFVKYKKGFPMPTRLPERMARSRVAATTEDFQALFLFYLGMALVALLFVAGVDRFERASGQSIAALMQQATPAGLLIDEFAPVWLPTSP